jgi:nucleotide-binding universal stress UspA family protein
MPSIRRILVPVDFSEPSVRALEYADEVARPFDATIDVLHVFDAPSLLLTGGLIETAPSDAAVVELAKVNAERALHAFIADARRRGIVVRSARAEIGPVPQTIASIAGNDAYDLIVIGTHGRTGLPRALIGSVAERVVRHAHCPVLTVRAST